MNSRLWLRYKRMPPENMRPENPTYTLLASALILPSNGRFVKG